MTNTDAPKPKPTTLPAQTVLAGLGIGVVFLLVGYQWGMRDGVVDVVAAAPMASSSASSTPAASSSGNPTSLAAEGDDVAACDAADRTVRRVVERSDLRTDHHAADGAIAIACRWSSRTYPPIAVSVIAGTDVDVDLVSILDETWTDQANMTNPRFYQEAVVGTRSYLRNPKSGVETLTQIDGMLPGAFPEDNPYQPVDIADDVRDALTK